MTLALEATRRRARRVAADHPITILEALDMPLVLKTLFALTFVPILLSAVGVVVRIRTFGRLDNNHPRLQQAELRGFGARVHGAHANSWEALLIFLTVVFIAHACGVPLAALDTVAVAFLVLRIVYCALYLGDLAWPRTGVFAAGMACCLYIVYLAATQAGVTPG